MAIANDTQRLHHGVARPRLSATLKSILGTVFSFEMSFVLFMFAVVFKLDPRLEWVPVDITQLLYALNVVCGLYLLSRRWFSLRGRVALLMAAGAAFCVYAAASLAWSPGLVYAPYKAQLMVAGVLWSIIVCAAIIASDPLRLRRLFLLLAVFAVWISVESLMQFIAALLRGTVLEGIYALGSIYLNLSRAVSIGMIIILGYLLYYAKSKRSRWVAGGLLLAFFIVMALLGGRAPFVALVAAGFVPLVLRWRWPSTPQALLRHYLLVGGIVAFLAIGVTAYVSRTGSLPGTLERIFGEGRLEESSSLRLEFYTHALSLWVNEGPVFGTGIGSWPIIEGEGDYASYPHNIILETCVELGSVGLGLLLAYCMLALHCLGPPAKVRGDPLRVILLMLFINALINALFSYDLPANRWLFAVCALMAYGAWMSMREQRAQAPCAAEEDPRLGNGSTAA